MKSAFYGRMKYGRCVQESFDGDHKPHKMGCFADIIRYIISTLYHWTFCVTGYLCPVRNSATGRLLKLSVLQERWFSWTLHFMEGCRQGGVSRRVLTNKEINTKWDVLRTSSGRSYYCSLLLHILCSSASMGNALSEGNNTLGKLLFSPFQQDMDTERYIIHQVKCHSHYQFQLKMASANFQVRVFSHRL